MSSHLTNFNKKHLKQDEQIIAVGEGYIGEMMGKGPNTQHNGILIVTNERVIFYRKGFFGEVLESIPLKAITSIERRSFLGHRVIKLHTSHDALEFKTFKKHAEELLIEGIETGRAQPNKTLLSAPPALPPTLPLNPIDLLQKLAELKNSGVLTEEEFVRKKAEILANIGC